MSSLICVGPIVLSLLYCLADLRHKNDHDDTLLNQESQLSQTNRMSESNLGSRTFKVIDNDAIRWPTSDTQLPIVVCMWLSGTVS